MSGPAGNLVRKLRPAKVSSAVRRRWFERRLGTLPLVPGRSLVDLGTTYGGWRIPDGVVGPDWVCYSVGAGGDISFDLELIRRYGATVRSIEAVEASVEHARAQAAGEPRLLCIHAAIAVADGPLRMQATHDPRSRSVSSAGLYDTSAWAEMPGRSLPSLAAELGDERVDLLKLDVEGGEYALLPALDLIGLGVRLFAVQLHHNGGVRGARRLIAGLREQGFELVAERPVVKLAFLRD
jgi:FkbM family methyltransferase